ncbi:UNVERIFIED_CONTAM: hypothetical protein RKD50_003289 [Streptomyces canus]
MGHTRSLNQASTLTSSAAPRISVIGPCVWAFTSPGTAISPVPSTASAPAASGPEPAGPSQAITPSSTRMSWSVSTRQGPCSGTRSTEQDVTISRRIMRILPSEPDAKDPKRFAQAPGRADRSVLGFSSANTPQARSVDVGERGSTRIRVSDRRPCIPASFRALPSPLGVPLVCRQHDHHPRAGGYRHIRGVPRRPAPRPGALRDRRGPADGDPRRHSRRVVSTPRPRRTPRGRRSAGRSPPRERTSRSRSACRQ